MRKLGKYEVLGELGHGAMGVVYRARDPIISRLVALKTITTRLADDPSLLQRFYREAQSAGGLQHPNIVTIYDMGDQDNTPYIAMELIDGESLEQIILRRAEIPIALQLSYAVQACRAFDYAHKRGIIHRDIKPGNVMVNKESVVKVVDFGIARALDTSKTQTGMLIGTFAYMSPEQYQGEHADARSDIWSFGVLLYELLAYQRPFGGGTPSNLMHSICSQEPRPLEEVAPGVPAEVGVILSKTLRKSADERFQSMEDLLLELEPVCQTLQSQAAAELVIQGRQMIEKEEFVQARDILRQALQVDSGNPDARALLEKVNAELKRIVIRPKAQRSVELGRAFLEEGKIQQAKDAADNAFQLDSTFEPARELQQQVQRELDRAQVMSGWLQGANHRLAEGMPDEAGALVAKALEAEPSNREAISLQQQVMKEKAERDRRLRLLEGMQRARSLWTQQNYAECIQLLADLTKEFPGEDEITRLLEIVREDKIEQEKQNSLQTARNLLATGRHEQCVALITDLQKQFPSDDEILKLLNAAREDQAEQRKLHALAEARNLLASGRYDESIALLSALQESFPGAEEIARLLETAREELGEQQKQRKLAEARAHLAAQRTGEALALLDNLRADYPRDSGILKLHALVHREQEKSATSQRMQGELESLKQLMNEKRYTEVVSRTKLLSGEFPNDSALMRLAEFAKAEQERMDLAQQTLVSLGPGAEVTKSLNSAQRQSQEPRRREQERKTPDVPVVGTSPDSVRGSQVVHDVLETKITDTFSSPVQGASREVHNERPTATALSGIGAPSVPPSPVKEPAPGPAAPLQKAAILPDKTPPMSSVPKATVLPLPKEEVRATPPQASQPLRAASASPAPPPVVPAPPLAKASPRGFYMAIGGLLVVAILAVAALYVPHRFKTHAGTSAAPTSSAPVNSGSSASGSDQAPPQSSPLAPALPNASPAVPATDKGVAAQSATEKPGAISVPKAPATANGATHTHLPQKVSSSFPTQTQSTPAPVPPQDTQPHAGDGNSNTQPSNSNAADLEEAEHQSDQLGSRASAVSQGIDALRRQQNAQGYGLRGDIVASEERMQANLARAQSALQRQDAVKAKKYLDMAEVDVEKLEKFLGR